MKMKSIFALAFRGISSVGSEHLPYKQRVGGSTPSSPTTSIKELEKSDSFFILFQDKVEANIKAAQKTNYFCHQDTKSLSSTKTKLLMICSL